MSTIYTVWNSAKKAPSEISKKLNFFRSKSKGAALDIISDICQNDKNAHIHIYGGDGSVYEACNAIMASGCNDTVTLSVKPSGTGNDFIKNFDGDHPESRKIDLISFNDKYAANELNMGFDCDVVVATDKIKKFPLCKGSIAYIIGVILTLLKPLGKEFDFTYVDENGAKGSCKGELLLCIVANGCYYGGGFKCAPRAVVDDGLLDLIYVKKVSHLEFISFVSGYKKGIHILENGKVNPQYEGMVTYKRIRSINLKGIGVICADGEVLNECNVDVKVAPGAINLYN